ncbi:MAG: GxxExxY protein [Candidatus Hydrogenedentota bacterium]|nr:MAG: GxxExxY protein [Candidatus Hydrogenedentota bacterium]
MSDPLTEKIIGAAIEVHKELGPGLLERIYEEALCYELEIRGIPFERQMEAVIRYKGRDIKGQRLDIVVDDSVVVELKSVSKLPEVAMAQVLSYLRATGLKTGLLINFNHTKLIDGVKRISL